MNSSQTNVPRSLHSGIYAALAARRTAFDTMTWQVPALGLTAQAFLLTIALGPTSAAWARVTTATLALITALVSIQTLIKHRANERTDAIMLEALEERYGVLVAGVHPHQKPRERAQGEVNNPDFRHWYVRKTRSVDLWIAALAAFALVALAAIAITAIDVDLLRTSR